MLEGAESHAPFAGEYGTLLAPTVFPVSFSGLLAVLEQTLAVSVLKLNVASLVMYTLVVEDARYALKQALGIVAFWTVFALSPPELVMGTRTTLLNHFAVGLVQLMETLLESPATLEDSPTTMETECPPFCTVSSKDSTMLKSETGVMDPGDAVDTGYDPPNDMAWAWLAKSARSKTDRNILAETIAMKEVVGSQRMHN